MTKLGVVVGEENWSFFKDICDDLAGHYQTEIYKRTTYHAPVFSGRLNRWAFHKGLYSILRRNDICFFEWSSELLMHASHMPKHCVIVTRLHSFELYEWAPKINWDAVDKVILLSQAMRQQFVNLYPGHSHKTEIVHNGISLDVFRSSAQRTFGFKLGMLCSIVPIKRIYEVILMLQNLRAQGYGAQLHIAGEPAGDYRYAAAVYRLVDRLDLQGSVVFDGYVTNTPVWLQQIDIFISNSYWEGQQVALLEAMVNGCYCLSHFWAGAEEMLPPENLYVTEAELQQKIIEYSEKSEIERHRCQVELQSIAHDKFDIERTKVQIRQIINEFA